MFAPLLLDVAHIAPCFAYRFRRDDESEAEYGRRVADLLEAEILARGPDTVMAFIAETVVADFSAFSQILWIPASSSSRAS